MTIENGEAFIRVRAYEIWEAAGRPHGHADEHWFQAVSELTLQSPPMVTPDIPAPKKPRKAMVRPAAEAEPVAKAPARKRAAEAKA